MYYTKIINPLSQLLCQKLIDLAKPKLGEPYLVPGSVIPNDIYNLLNFDLKSKTTGLEISHVLFFSNSLHVPFHVDRHADQPNKASLVVPLILSKGCRIQWQDGNYELNLAKTADNNDYFSINWITNPNIVKIVELDSAAICRTDIPHGLECQNNDWLIATIRFTENLDILELQNRLNMITNN
jgi:hypothetical protein